MKEVCPTMILTLFFEKFNILKNEICGINASYLETLRSNGLFSDKYKEYKISYNYHDYILKCPIIKTSINSDETSVLLPSFKLPRRKYPVFVYLYAVTLYLYSEISMRKVAALVCKRFGLKNFSHSTISRSLKKLTQNLEFILKCSTSGIHSMSVRNEEPSLNRRATLLDALIPVLSDPLDCGNTLAYEFFSESCGNFII